METLKPIGSGWPAAGGQDPGCAHPDSGPLHTPAHWLSADSWKDEGVPRDPEGKGVARLSLDDAPSAQFTLEVSVPVWPVCIRPASSGHAGSRSTGRGSPGPGRSVSGASSGSRSHTVGLGGSDPYLPAPPPHPRPNTMSQTGKVAWTEPQMYMVEGGGGRVVMLPALGPERI